MPNKCYSINKKEHPLQSGCSRLKLMSLRTPPHLWIRQVRHFYFFLFLLSRKARNATIKLPKEIPIIPNIRCCNNELLPEFLSAIPKNSTIAVGTHGFIKTKQEKYEWYCFLENIIQALNPSTIIVYGHLTGSIFDDLKARVNFIFYDSWINTRFKEVKRNGN